MRIVLDENGIVSQEDLAGHIEDKSKGAWINISSIDIIDTLELAQKAKVLCERVINYLSCPELPEVEQTDDELNI